MNNGTGGRERGESGRVRVRAYSVAHENHTPPTSKKENETTCDVLSSSGWHLPSLGISCEKMDGRDKLKDSAKDVVCLGA